MISEAMIRPACFEEILESELLQKRTKGVKRFRGFGYEDVAQPHQLGTSQQQSYMDFSKEIEKDLLEDFRPGTAAPTEAGGDDESPKRRREVVQEMSPEDVPVPVAPTPTTPPGEEDGAARGESSPMASAPPVTALTRALRSNPDRFDVGRGRASGMNNLDEELSVFLPIIPGEEA